MEKTTGFVFQQSYYDSVKMMGDADRLAAMDVLLDYVFTGALPADDAPIVARMWFTMARPTVDASLKRYASAVSNGKKGGRKPKKEADAISVKPKANLNSNINSNNNSNIIASPFNRGEAYDKYDLSEIEF